MLEKLPITLHTDKTEASQRRIYVAGLCDEIVDRANILYQAIRNSRYLPQSLDTPLLSGDEEHLWIGLAP